jgi:hypothetical protein
MITARSLTPLPTTCSIAFKEWEGVCRALACGAQSIILRKGGIDEGPRGFEPEFDAFWLYPTRVHEAQQGLRPFDPPPAQGNSHEEPHAEHILISALAQVELVGRVDRPEQLPALEELHVWTAETVAKRFHYRQPGLWVLGLRIHRRLKPYRVGVTPAHAGCKSWVELDGPLSTTGLEPVLEPEQSHQRMHRLRTLLDSGGL